MEDKTKIKTTAIRRQQVFTNSHQPLEDNRKIKTALTINNQWKTKQKQKQHQQVFTNSHQKTTTNLPIIRKQQINKNITNN